MPLNTSGMLSSLRAQQFQSNQMVSKLVGFKREQTVNPLQDQKKSINNEIDHVNSVTKKMSSLLDSINNIATNLSGYNGGGGGSLIAENYDNSIVDATATNSATAGNYGVDVNQLAQSQILRNDDLYGSDTGGSLTATSNFGGVSSATAGPNAIAGTKNVTVNSLYQQEINKSNVYGSATGGMEILSNSDSSVATANPPWNATAGEYTLTTTHKSATRDIWQSDVFATKDGSSPGLVAESDDTNVAFGTAQPGATTGDYSITVNQAAREDTEVFSGNESSVSAGKLEIGIDTDSASPINQTINLAGGQTMYTVARMINNDTDIGDKVHAVAKDSGKLLIHRSETGHTVGGSSDAALTVSYDAKSGSPSNPLSKSGGQTAQNLDYKITHVPSGDTTSGVQRSESVQFKGATFHLGATGSTNVNVSNNSNGGVLQNDQTIEIYANQKGGVDSGGPGTVNLKSGDSLEDIKSKIDNQLNSNHVETSIISDGGGYRLKLERVQWSNSNSNLSFNGPVSSEPTALGFEETQDATEEGYDYTLTDSNGDTVAEGSAWKGFELGGTNDKFNALGTEYTIGSVGTTTIEVGQSSNSVVQKGELSVGYETDAGGSNSTNINIAKGDSLVDVRDKINNDSAINSYITASIVNEGGGYKLKLEHTNKGDGNEITGLNFSSGGSDGQALDFGTTEQESTDGSITVDGTTTTAESNSITYNDVTYDLASTTSGTVDVQEGSSVGAGTLDIDVDGSNADSLTINHGDSLSDVATKINNSSANSSIEASVVSAGPSDNQHKLEVKRTDPGTSNSVSLSHTLDADATGDKLTFSDFQSAQDATGTVDGNSFTSSNNQITKSGLDLTLNAKGETTVEVNNDGGGSVGNTDDFKKDIEDFVDKYNAAIEKLNEESDLSRGSKWRAKRAMQDVIAERVDGMTGEYGNLSSIGLETNYETGKLSINDSKLDGALNDKPDTVGAIFGKQDDGINDELSSVIEGYVGPGESVFDTKIDSLENREQTVQDDISEAREDVSSYQDKIADRFQKLKTMRFQMQRNFASLLG